MQVRREIVDELISGLDKENWASAFIFALGYNAARNLIGDRTGMAPELPGAQAILPGLAVGCLQEFLWLALTGFSEDLCPEWVNLDRLLSADSPPQLVDDGLQPPIAS